MLVLTLWTWGAAAGPYSAQLEAMEAACQMEPPEHGDLARVQLGPRGVSTGRDVRVSKWAISGYYRRVSKPEELAPLLEEDPQVGRVAQDQDRVGIRLLIDEDVPAERAIAVLKVIRDSGERGVMLIAKGVDTARPVSPAPAIERRILGGVAAAAPETRLSWYARQVVPLAEACPGAEAMYHDVAIAEPSTRCGVLVAGLRALSETCPEPAFRDLFAAVYAWEHPPAPTTHWPMRFRSGPMTLRGKTWADLAPSLSTRASLDLGPPAAPSPSQAPKAVLIPGEPRITGAYNAHWFSTVLLRGRDSLLECPQAELARDPSLEGVAHYRLQLGPGGFVESVTTLTTSLNNDALHGCMADRLSRLSFPGTNDGRPARVDVEFAFSSR